MGSEEEKKKAYAEKVDNYHMWVGKLIRAWAELERILFLYVELLLGVDQFRARIILASIGGTRQQREFVLRLAETYMNEDLLPEFRALIQRYKKFSRERNLLAHAGLMLHPKTDQFTVFRDAFPTSENGAYKFEKTELPPERLKELIKSIKTLQTDFLVFTDKCDGKIFFKTKAARDTEDQGK